MHSFPRQRRVMLLFCALVLSAIGAATAANPDHVDQLRNTGKCSQCDLSGAKLGGWQLAGADLSGANLHEAELYGANLRGANLAGAILADADLKLADLTGATDAALASAQTDERTTCPNGDHGPCQ